MILKDKEIKKQALRVDKASRETVDLDGLALKIFGKYLKYLQGKVLDRQQRPVADTGGNKTNLKPPAPLPPEPIGNMTEDFGSQSVSVHMSEFPIERSAQDQGANTNKLVAKAKEYASKVGQAAQDLNSSVMSVTSRYRHENQNSIYYLRPNSNDIYFLDFKMKGFVREQLKWHKSRGTIPA